MNTKSLRTPAVLALALATASCATNSDIQKLQSQITDLQDQVSVLKRTASSKEEVQGVNNRIAEQTQTLLKSNATLVAKVDQIEEKINGAQGANEQSSYRLDKLGQQVTQTQHELEEMRAALARQAATAAPVTPPVVVPSTPAGGGGTAPAPAPSNTQVNVAASEDPVDVYQSAFRDYQKGNYDLAIAGFRDFVTRSPNSPLVDNATYWIGESFYSQKKYKEAIQQFDTLVTKYPKSAKVAAALLKKGYSYISLGDKAEGIVQLQYVVHEHPQSQEAALARQKLRALGVETR